ncbi:MAG: hypothetical protein JSV78_10935 [Phycisphaerales bacterium]|nr:MAG: hypothetical protein JSV78_10935 [Phycisphaerales bacterium]
MATQNSPNKGLRVFLIAAVIVTGTLAHAAEREGKLFIAVAEEFDGAAPVNALVAAKQNQGLVVKTYVVTSGMSAETLKNEIESLWGTQLAPDYILLIGDAPAVPYWTGGGSKHAVTDLPYGCMDEDDDWFPEIPVGRFAVSSLAQLEAVVDKTLTIEGGSYIDPDYVKRATFLASSDMASGAEETHDWVIENYILPAEYDPILVYAAQGGSTSDVTEAVNNGTLFMVYFGHSDSGGWWAPSFDQDDIQNLSNDGLYGLVFGFSCNTAHFDYPECFGETWIRETHKGAAAYISASNYIYYGGEQWESSRRLEKYFFESFFVDDIWEIGPAWHAGLYRLLADPDYGDGDITRNMFEMFAILGDPSLLLPQPFGFGISPDPLSQQVCSPPDDQAQYTIEVRGTGDFDEVVTLTASGEPNGTSVSFSVNSQVPPFDTVMTVSGLIGVPPDTYDILITGTSATMEKSASVALHVANSVPGSVTLDAPADGAVEVSRTPQMTWLPVTQAATYDLEIATDGDFTNVIYSTTSTDTTHVVEIMLDADTTYYWHVSANNACGTSGYSDAFSFTTLAQGDYFTQDFSSGFDLDGYSLSFIPNGSGNYYGPCRAPASQLPTDPSGGSTLSLSDDGSAVVTATFGQVALYGTAYNSFYVNANGNITFNSGDSTYDETIEAHFSKPRVAALFDDLNPSAGGTVSYRDLADRMAVTWENVPEYSATGSNTFQIELFYNGVVRITWAGVDSADPLIGLSAGNGIPDDFIQTDLSTIDHCAGDINEDCYIDLMDYDLFAECLAGPNESTPPLECDTTNFELSDMDNDNDVDLEDFWRFLDVFITL